jgi:hypothetical protein
MKNVNLIMENGKKINALLDGAFDSGSSPIMGLLYNIDLEQNEINKIYKHGLKFNINDGEELLTDCKIFNIDDKYIKFICKYNK